MSATLTSAYLPLVLLFWSLCTLHSAAISCPSPHIQSLLMTGNAPPANIVLGQSSFTSSDFGSSLDRLDYPIGVAVSPLSGKVFISDTSNNRILRFAPPVLGQMGGTAEAVFGSTGAGCQQAQMHHPYGIFVDSHDSLWVADATNVRVLRFDNSSYVESGAPASLVLGQTNFGSCNNGDTCQTRFDLPTGLWVEADDTLWVADNSGKVFRFDNAHQKVNGAPADGILRTSSMMKPRGVVVSKNGDLYVSDSDFPRVIRFKGAKRISSQVEPDGLWGQSSYQSQNYGITINTFQSPYGVAIDDCNNLFVGDSLALRVTMFPNADGATALPNATLVFGQPGFTGATVHRIPSASTFSPDVEHIFYDTKNLILWVVDSVNNRVLGWAYDGQGSGGSTTSPSSTTSSATTAGGTTSSNQVAEDGAATLDNFVTYLRSSYRYFE